MDTARLRDILQHEEQNFASAVITILTGDVGSLISLLFAHPSLIVARSNAPHRCTLLHYIAANGIEDDLQHTTPNATKITTLLLDAGAEVDALCSTYGGGRLQTPLNLLVSSIHPHKAGVQADLVNLLCKAGALVNGLDDNGSPLATALAFGYPKAAAALIHHGARIDNLVFAAAAGDLQQVQSYFTPEKTLRPSVGHCDVGWFQTDPGPAVAAEQALVFACMTGQLQAARFLLEHGVSINACPPGSQVTATPLHTAAWQGNRRVVTFLLEHGADPTLKDHNHHVTPAGWAHHAGFNTLAKFIDHHTRTPIPAPGRP